MAFQLKCPESFCVTVSSDGFNRVLTVRPHQTFSKIHEKVAPLHKILLYFFIVAPGRRWHVKKIIKNVESVVAACSASAR